MCATDTFDFATNGREILNNIVQNVAALYFDHDTNSADATEIINEWNESGSASTNEVSNTVESATLSQVDRTSPSPSQRSLEEDTFDPHDVSASSSVVMVENASQDSTSDIGAAQTELPSHSESQDDEQTEERNTETALNEVFDMDFGNSISATDAVLETAETDDITPNFYSDLNGNEIPSAPSDLDFEPATYETRSLIEEPIAEVEDIDAMDMDDTPASRLSEDDDSGSWLTETECSEVFEGLEESSKLLRTPKPRRRMSKPLLTGRMPLSVNII